MAIFAPPSRNISPDLLAQHQQEQAPNITAGDAALNQRLQALPEYQAYRSALTGGFNPTAIDQTRSALAARLQSENVPASSIFDPFTGQFRQKNWNERNSNWSALLYSGAAVGAGLGAGAAVGALGGGAAAGGAATGSSLPAGVTLEGLAVGPGATTIPAGGSLASLGGGAAATSTLGPTSAASMAATTAGTTAPASLAAPTAAGGFMSTAGKVINGLTGGNPYGALLNAGLGYLQERQSANAIQTAADQQLTASREALAEQRRQYDLGRQDYLGNQAYTRQQISGLAPYQQIGSGALANLGRLTGQTLPANFGQAPPVASLPPPQATAPQGPPGSVASPNGYTISGLANPQLYQGYQGGSGPVAPTPGSGGQFAASPQAPQPQGASSYVTMRAPTGETQQVPANQASHYEQLGAQRVN